MRKRRAIFRAEGQLYPLPFFKPTMNRERILASVVVSLIVFVFTGCEDKGTNPVVVVQGEEPTGGQWIPIVLTSGSAIRLPAPPAVNSMQFTLELQELRDRQATRTAQITDTANFWNMGASVRWNEIARSLVIKDSLNFNPVKASRIYALVSVAQYDALVATWNNKYFYNRPPPSEFDRAMVPLVASTGTPAYPSEHSAVAAASVAVLTYIYPAEAVFLTARLREEEESRMWAGVSCRSDILAGDTLGRIVAQKVIGRALTDHSDAVWTGTAPTGPGYWFSSENPPQPPLLPLWGSVRPWLMTSGNQFRPSAPPAFRSPEFNSALSEVRQIADNRTPERLRIARFWADLAGTFTPPGHWNEIACNLITGRRVNELRSARALALMNMAIMDAGISCWDAKYAYWLLRPPQADPAITTPIGLPNFPSYTSGHSTFSGAAADVLGYIFPDQAVSLEAMAHEASISRVYAGIHYRFDCETGVVVGQMIAQLAIQRGRADGSSL
ncbi:MAG: vanadium-dependent haloperoxidase [Bacteroidota bacterium]